MKKVLAFLALVVVIFALLPIMGNKLVEEELANKVEVLVSYGVEVSKSTTDSSYLNTKKHYEFLVKDTEKFVQYLSQFSDAQLPPYVNAMVDGVLVGVDIKYSNIPISDGLLIDIYPLSLSKKMMENLENDDKDFYKYFKNLLQNKGVLYHINYNVVNSGFDGYIQDINEEYVLKNKSKVTLKLLNASFEGSGLLIAPDSLTSKIETVIFTLTEGGEEFNVLLKGLSTASTFESQSTYASSARLKTIEVTIKGSSAKDAIVKVDDLHINASANTQGEKAEYNVKTSCKELDINAQSSNLQAYDFNYDISLTNVDKDSIEELRVLVSEASGSSSPESEEKIKASAVNVISKGLSLVIADFSLAQIAVNKAEKIKGFSLKAKLDLQEDADVAGKIKNSPVMLAQNIDLDVKFRLSKALFTLLNKQAPMSALANNYAKEEGEDLVFDIQFNKGQLTLNGKKPQ